MTGGAPRGALTACVATRALASVGPRLADPAGTPFGAVTVPEPDGVRTGTSGNAPSTATVATSALDVSSDTTGADCAASGAAPASAASAATAATVKNRTCTFIRPSSGT